MKHFLQTLLLLFAMTAAIFSVKAQNVLNEGFESTTFPPGDWTTYHVSGSSSWTRTTTSAYVYSGLASAKMGYASAGHENYLITPQLHPLTGEALTFYIRKYYSGTDMEIMVSTTTNDVAAFTTLQTITDANITTSFVQKTIDISAYVGQNIYIAFHVVDDNGSDLYIDDVTGVSLFVPTCPKPTTLTSSAITTTTATLSWTPTGTEQNWNIEYGPAGFTQGAGDIVASTNNIYQLNGLTANTNYDFYVQADCGEGDLSAWSAKASFTTPCDPYTIPYFEGFENGYTHNTTISGCISQQSISGSSSWTSNTSFTDRNRTPRTGSWNAFLQYSNSNWMFIPVALEAGQSYDFSMYARQDASAGCTMKVSYGTANDAASMVNEIVAETAVTLGDYQELAGSFIPAISGTYYVGICATLTSSPWYVSVDDISLVVSPTCVKPISLVVSNVTAHAAEIAWTDNNVGTESWVVNINGVDTVVDTNPFTLADLAANTDYTISVQAICSETDSSEWSNTIAFTTPCESITTLPYTEGFEGAYPTTCWDMYYANSSYPAGNAMSHSNSQSYEGTYSYRFSSYSSGSPYDQYLTSPEINVEDAYLVSFQYRRHSSYGNDSFRFGYSSNSNDVTSSDFTWSETVADASYTSWQEYSMIVPAGTKYFAIHYNVSSSLYYLYLDNVVVRQLSSENDILTFTLPEATQPAVIDAENHTVNVEVSVNADLTAQTPTITVSDLATISPLSGVAQDFTAPVVYTVTAEDATEQAWTVTVVNAVGASSAKDIVSFTFATQVGDAVIDTIAHTVNAVAEWDTDLTAVAPTITVSDLATISPLSGEAQDFTAPFVYTVMAEDSTEQAWTVTIVNDPTACPNPTEADLQMNILATSATFTWSPVYLETSYNAKVSNVAIDPATDTANVFEGVINDTTVTITGLYPNTTYYCYLQSNCGTTEWLSGSFTTPCAAVTAFPWSEDFTSTTFVPDCWMQERTAVGTGGGTDYPDGAWARYTGVYINNNTPVAQLRDTRAGSKHNLVTAPLDFTYEGGYYISLDVYRNATGTSYLNEGIRVLVSNTPSINETTDTLGFISRNYTVASTINGNIIGAEAASGWFTYELPITRTGVYYIIFEGNSQWGSSTYMDNIIVDEIPTCQKPTAVTAVNVYTQSADVTWTANSGENSWNVEYGVAGFTHGTGTSVVVDTNFIHLDSLTSNTDYEVYVQAICSESDTSDWCRVPASFYTGFCIPAPTSVNGTGITNVTFGYNQVVNNNTHPTSAPFYGDYTAQIGDVQQGMVATVNITLATGYTYGTPIWVNWNNDCVFTDDELVFYTISPATNPTTVNATFLVPATTPLGSYRMRIGGANTQFDDENSLNPCLSTSYTIYEDYTLQVLEAPACLPVVDLTVNNITNHEAQISWTEQGNAENWIIMLNDSAILVTDNPFTLVGLTSNTDYTVQVQAICSETDSSDWSASVAFTTACDAVTAFPWTEDFESTTFVPDCWMQERTAVGTGGGTDYPDGAWARYTGVYINNNTPVAQLRDTRAGSKHNLVTAPLDFTYEGGYYISLDVYRNATGTSYLNEGIRVLVSNTPSINETTDTLGFISRNYTVASTINGNIIGAEAASGWFTYELPITRTGVNYIIFEGNSQYGSSTYMDNIIVDQIPTCLKPTALTVSNVTAHSAEIAWTDNNVGTESWAVNINGVDTVVDTNPFTLTDLAANTDYTISVRAICSETDSSDWSTSVAFTTPCESITTLPYTEGFEGAYPTACWDMYYANSSYPAGNAMTHTTDAAYEGTYSYRFSSFSSGSPYDQYLISPEFNVEGDYLISFKYKRSDDGSEVFRVGYSSNSNDVTSSDFTWGTSVDNASVSWQEYSMLVPAGTKYFAIHYSSNYEYYLYIDNVVVRQISSENDILTFTLPEATQPAVIDAENHTVNVEISYSADITAQTPTITVSDYATINPLSGVTQDFTDTVTYIVTAEDQTQQPWTVIVTQALVASSAKDIVTFTFNHQVGDAVIDTIAHTVNAVAEWDADLTAIAPVITVSYLATITPLSGEAQDFTAPFVYTVMAEDSTEQAWTVTIVNDPSACPNPVEENIAISTLSSSITVTWEQAYLETSYNAKLSTVAIDPATEEGDVFDAVVNDTFVTISGLTSNTTYYAYLQSNCGTDEWINATITTACDVIAVTDTTPYSEGFESADFVCWNTEIAAGSYDWTPSTGDYVSGSQSAYLTYDALDAYLISPIFDLTGITTQPQLRFFHMQDDYFGGVDELKVLYRTDVNAAWTELADYTALTTDFIEETIILPNPTATYQIAFEGICDDNYGMYIDDVVVEAAQSCIVPSAINVATSSTTADITWTAYSGENSWNVEYGVAGFAHGTGTSVIVDTTYIHIDSLTSNTEYEFYVQAICSETDSSDWSAPVAFQTACDVIAVTDATPYNEGFESADFVCWNSEIVTGIYDWTPSDGAYVSGSQSAYLSYSALDAYLISPIFDLTGITTQPQLRFFHKQADWLGGVDELKVLYRTDANAAWTELADYTASTTNFIEETIILPNPTATYQIAFEGICDDNLGMYIDDVVVEAIPDTTTSCETPTNVVVTPDSTSVAVSWTATDEDAWNIEYGPAGFTQGTGTMINNVTNPYTITGLTPSTDYDVYVQAVCSEDSVSDWSTVASVTTTPTGISQYPNLTVALFPNPANSVINVRLSDNLAHGSIALYDVYGKLLKQVSVESNLTAIQIEDLSTGVYFVRIFDGNNALQTMKVIKK